MPYRKIPFIVGEVYHVFNRSIARQPIFLTNRDYQRALEVIYFYSFTTPPLRFSHYNRLPESQKSEFLENLKMSNKKLVEIVAFSLMPNHFHFLLKEILDKGITTFMSNFQNSYAKYFNLRQSRSGALFQAMFKAVRIESDEQFIHVARYIHLNPLTSFVIKETEELITYPWTSFPEYIGNIRGIITQRQLLEYFSSSDDLKSFTFNQVDYQRHLDKIKHLTLE